MFALLLIFWVLAIIVCVIKVLAQIAAAEPLKRMSWDEEAKYELHPTVTPQTVTITDENVRDIINISIEEGLEHPALVARKNS